MDKQILASVTYPNPADHNISVILAETFRDFVIWDHNKVDDSYFNGRYFPIPQYPSKKEAKKAAYEAYAKTLTELVKRHA